MEKRVRKKGESCNKQKSKQEYAQELREGYKSGIKYYEKVDKE